MHLDFSGSNVRWDVQRKVAGEEPAPTARSGSTSGWERGSRSGAGAAETGAAGRCRALPSPGPEGRLPAGRQPAAGRVVGLSPAARPHEGSPPPPRARRPPRGGRAANRLRGARQRVVPPPAPPAPPAAAVVPPPIQCPWASVSGRHGNGTPAANRNAEGDQSAAAAEGFKPSEVALDPVLGLLLLLQRHVVESCPGTYVRACGTGQRSGARLHAAGLGIAARPHTGA